MGWPKRLPGPGSGQGFVEGAAGEAEGGGADGGAEDVEGGHGDAEAGAGWAEAVGGGDAAVGEAEGGEGVGCGDVDAFGEGEAGGVGGNEEGGQGLGAGCVLRAGEDDVVGGDGAVADPGLFAVEDVAVAVEYGSGGEGGDVGAGLLFAEGEGGEVFAGADGGEEAGLLFGGAEEGDGSGAEALHGEGEVGEAGEAGEGFAEDAEGADVERGAVRGAGVVEEAGLAHGPGEAGDGAVGVVVVGEAFGVGCGPVLGRFGEGTVAGFEEGPLQKGSVGHPGAPPSDVVRRATRLHRS